MAEDLKLPISLESSFDPKGTQAAQTGLKGTTESAKETESAAKELGYTTDALKRSLMQLLAFAEVIAQFKEGFEQVSKLEQVFNSLERATKRNGDSFETVKGRIEEFADKLKLAAGLDDDVVIPSVVKLYNATGDLEKSLTLSALAADTAVHYHMDLAVAQDLVLKAAQGQTRGLKDLGISVDENLIDKGEKASVALGALQERVKGAASEAKGLTVDLHRMGEQWEDIRNGIVERVIPAFRLAFNTVVSFFRILDTAYQEVGNAVATVYSTAVDVGKGFAALLRGNAQEARGFFRSATEGLKQGVNDATGIARAGAKAVEDVWSGAGKKVAIEYGDARKAIIKAEDDGQKKAKETHDYKIEQLRAEVQAASGFAKVRAQIALAEYEYEQSLLRVRKEGFGKDAKEVQQINATLAARLKAIWGDYYKTTETAEERALEKARQMAEKILADKRRQAQEEMRIQEGVNRFELASLKAREDATRSAISGILTSAGEAFGIQKEISAAQAIISTYEAAAKALTAGPIIGPILAALTVALGLANVATILSTEPARGGAGFDDPSNDYAAYLGGRKWARDMTREWAAGASAGWQSGMGVTNQNTTNDNRQTTNVHFHGVGLLDSSSQASMQKLSRALKVVDSNYENRYKTGRTR